MHSLEGLEARIAPATISLSYTDVDGDVVKIIASKRGPVAPPLSADDLTFVGGGSDGQLARLDLSDPGFSGATIVFKVAQGPAGNKLAHVGVIDATGLDLHKLSVVGDLGKILVGSDQRTVPAIKTFSVDSFATKGLQTQGNEGDLTSVVGGALPDFRITGHFGDGTLNMWDYSASTKIHIGGSFGEGHISAVAGVKAIKIKGYFGGTMNSAFGIGSVEIGGDLRGTIHSESISSVRVGGDVLGGDEESSGSIFSNWVIGKVRIDGDLIGGKGNRSGRIEALDSIGPIRIGGDVVGGSIEGNESLTRSGGISAKTISTLTIAGSLIAGRDASEGTLTLSGAISSGSIGSMKVSGDLRGNETHPVQITTSGNLLVKGFEIGIGSLSVGGDVKFANVLAGFGENLYAGNADASIGKVVVKGDWIASNLVAGAQDSGARGFGVGDTLQDVDDSPTAIARIAEILIKGAVIGTTAPGDSFGFVAQEIGKLSIAGKAITLATGASSSTDNFVIPSTNDVRLLEVAPAVPG